MFSVISIFAVIFIVLVLAGVITAVIAGVSSSGRRRDSGFNRGAGTNGSFSGYDSAIYNTGIVDGNPNTISSDGYSDSSCDCSSDSGSASGCDCGCDGGCDSGGGCD